MANLFIKETYVNDTEGHQFGDSGWYETFTSDKGELFQSLRSEYGKASNIYQDQKSGKPKKIGWVFTKRIKYEDCKEYYTRSVWVEVSETEPVKECKTLNITHPF